MEKNTLSLPQEGLKLLAALTMFVDHVGLCFAPEADVFRIIGRVAMPLYCFLLVEGFQRTRSRRRYLFRLGFLAALSEFPFDCMVYGGISWAGQNVVFTLLLAFLAMLALREAERLSPVCRFLLSFLAAAAASLAAELLRTDYGGIGVLFVLLFYCTRELPSRNIWQSLGFLLLAWFSGSRSVELGSVRVPMELFGVLAMLPIALYQGERKSRSQILKWGFALFYPAHMLVLSLLAA